MSKMSPNAKAMAADVKSGAISIETLESAEKAATISTKLLGTAFKMFASIGVMLAIDVIVSGIQKLANAGEEEKNRIEENLSVAKEHEETLKSESEAIDDIISQYEKYKDITNLTSDNKKELFSIQDTLTSQFGKEAKNIDLVNGKYQEQYDLLRGIKVEKASQEYNASNTTLDELKNSLVSKSKDSLIDYYDETGTSGILAKLLENNGGFKTSSAWGGTANVVADLLSGNELTLNKGNIEEQAKWISQALDILNEYRDTQKEVEIKGKQVVLSETSEFSDLYKTLTELQGNYTEYFTELETKAQNAVKKFTMNIDGVNYDSSNVTSDVYKTWRENLLEQYEKDKDGLSKDIADYLDKTYTEAEYQYQLLSEEDKRRYDISHSWGDNIQSQSFSDWLTDNTDALDTVQDKASSLSKTLQSLTDGSITDTELIDLFQDFPDLSQYAGDTDKLKSEIEKLINENPQDLINSLELLKKSLPDGSDKNAVDSLITSLKKLGTVSADINEIQITSDDIVKAYEGAYDKAIEKLNEESDLLENQKDLLSDKKQQIEDIVSQYEQAESAVEKYIDTQKEALEKEKSIIEDKYNTQIEAIQKSNDEQETAINLQEKLDALNNAKNKKTRQYSESNGWSIVTNTSEVSKAQQNYDKALSDKRVKDLENQRDKETSTIDNEITKWEDYAQSWKDAVNNIKNADDKFIASKILGSDWTEKISDKDITVLNNFANNYKSYQSQLSGQIDKEIDAIEKAIKNKKKQIDTYNKEKDKLSEYVKDITDKNSEYISNIQNTADLENATMTTRIAFLEDMKNRARNALDWSELNQTGISDKGGYIVEYNGKTIGVAENEIEAHNIRAKYIGQMLSSQLNGVSNISSSKLIELQKEIESKFNIIKPYSAGGVNDYTGLAMLHGTPNNSEMIFNSTQAKKLYDIVVNSDNLVNYIGNKLTTGIKGKIINNTSSDNFSLVFNGNIVANNPTEFMSQMNSFIKKAQLEKYIGR